MDPMGLEKCCPGDTEPECAKCPPGEVCFKLEQVKAEPPAEPPAGEESGSDPEPKPAPEPALPLDRAFAPGAVSPSATGTGLAARLAAEGPASSLSSIPGYCQKACKEACPWWNVPCYISCMAGCVPGTAIWEYRQPYGGDRAVPRPVPVPRPDDCAQRCLPYLGPWATYVGSDGHVYRNDLTGQHAFQRCVSECRFGRS